MALATLGIQQARAQRPDSTGADSAARAPQVRTAVAYMNIGLSALTDFGWSTERNVRSLQLGDHDPRVLSAARPVEG